MASCKYKYINYSRRNNAKKNIKTIKGAGKKKYKKRKQLRWKPEKNGGGNLISRIERLSVENSKKPKNKQKKKLRWADGAHDPSWGHQWLPSEEDSSNIENVKEIDARSECFDETRGKSYEHSYALEKEKPGSSLGWPPPDTSEREWFNTCLNEYRKNP